MYGGGIVLLQTLHHKILFVGIWLEVAVYYSQKAAHTWSVYSGFVSVHCEDLMQLKNKQGKPSGET